MDILAHSLSDPSDSGRRLATLELAFYLAFSLSLHKDESPYGEWHVRRRDHGRHRWYRAVLCAGNVLAAVDIDEIVDGLDKGDIGRPLIGLLVHDSRGFGVESLLVGVDGASVGQESLSLSDKGVSLKAPVTILFGGCLLGVTTELAVGGGHFATVGLHGSDLDVRIPDVLGFLCCGPFVGSDVDGLIESDGFLDLWKLLHHLHSWQCRCC